MKHEYETPTLTIMTFLFGDVITTSGDLIPGNSTEDEGSGTLDGLPWI